MKRKWLSILLVGAMTLSLAACGSSDSKDEKKSEEGGHKLSIMAWDPAFNIPAIQAAADDYKENVDSEFELEILEQGGSEDVETAITTAGSAGDYSNLPDIVLFQDHYIHRYVADYPDAWTSLGDIDINWDDFAAEKIDYSTIDGEHYGVPVDNGTVVCAYRTDLLEQAGYTIDDLTGCTWDKFMEVGKAVKEKTGKALLCMNSDGNDLPYMMMQAEGVSQFKDGKPYITENETLVTIVEKLVEMAKEGYASNGGSSLYITSNCGNVDLAKDFLAYTFGGSTTTYDNALRDGGVISTYAPAGETEVYNEGVEFFNNQPIYADIVEMGTHVQKVEQSDFHYAARDYVGSAIVKIINGTDTMDALKEAEDQLNFDMGN